MKSKYIATYGKKITASDTQSDCGSYRIDDNFRRKSKLTAPLSKVQCTPKAGQKIIVMIQSICPKKRGVFSCQKENIIQN